MLPNFFSRLLNKVAFLGPGGGSLRPMIHRWRGVRIGKDVWISQYVIIDELHPEAITIGDRCSVSYRVSIFSHFYWGPRRPREAAREVVIEEDTFVGPHTVIMPGVRIGAGSVIRAGSVVSRNVPPRTLWGPPAGAPLAQVTVPLTAGHSYEEFVAGLKPLPGRDSM